MGTRTLPAVSALALCLGAASAAPALAQSEQLRRQAFDLVYNLEYDRAMAVARQAVAADPDEAANHLALASVAWQKMLSLRGAVTVEEYLGPPPKGDVKRAPPPADLAAAFRTSIDAALAIAERRLRQRPNDIDAQYILGAAIGRLAAYTASEEGKVRASVGAARRAFDAHERVLDLDPRRKDAGLVLGTYRYIVSTLSLFKRWLAYMAGFGGNKDRALSLLAECAAYPSDVQTEARFALLVVYGREGRFEDGLRVLRDLRALYPRNRLLWLETGAAYLRAGRAEDALRWFNDGMAMLALDTRPRVFGEDAMWRLDRGSALAALGRETDARADAEAAVSLPSQLWVRGRVFVLLGHAEDLAGNRAGALRAYRRGADTCRRAGDEAGVKDAERWLDKPFRGTSGVPARQYR